MNEHLTVSTEHELASVPAAHLKLLLLSYMCSWLMVMLLAMGICHFCSYVACVEEGTKALKIGDILIQI